MTYLTDFSTLQVTDGIIGQGNINITGNIIANSEQLQDTLLVGNLSINPDEASGNVVVSLSGSNAVVELQAPTVVQGNMSISSLNVFSLPGGNSATYLATDGSGNLTWSVPQGQGNGVVGPGVGSIQFNNGNGFGGDVGNLYANLSNTGEVTQLNVNIPIVMGNASGANGFIASNVSVYASAPNLFISGGANGQVLYSSGSSNVYWADLPVNPPSGGLGALQFDNGNGGFAGTANLAMSLDDTVETVVTMRSNSFTITANATDTTISNDNGNITITPAGTLVLPDEANVSISGGANNFVLTTDGTGNLSWTPRTLFSVVDVANAGPYTPDADVHDIITVSYPAPVSITLPAPTSGNIGTFVHIKDVWGGGRATSPITITTTGGNTIDGQANVQITGDFNNIQIAQVTANNWGVL